MAAGPGVLDPGVLDPGVLDPGVLDPGVLDPGVLDPGVWDGEAGCEVAGAADVFLDPGAVECEDAGWLAEWSGSAVASAG